MMEQILYEVYLTFQLALAYQGLKVLLALLALLEHLGLRAPLDPPDQEVDIDDGNFFISY